VSRTTAETIDWYRNNEVWPEEIGFDPDGMCQKICRTARGIGSGYASALAQQQGTPASLRVYDVEKITRGMVLFYDDPNDANPYGHIVTVVARKKGGDRGDLSNLLVRTNSVTANKIVVVDGAYFPRYWGDKFQFAGKTLNGVVLDLPDTKPEPDPLPTLPKGGVARLERMLDIYDEMIENHSDRARFVRAFRRDKREIRQTIERLTQKRK
jgi:hypothetical protein